MKLQDYLKILRTKWVLIVASTLVFTGIAALLTIVQTPEFRTTTQLYVSVRTGESSTGDLVQGNNFVRGAVISYVDVVGTAIVLDRVSETLGGTPTAPELAKSVSASSPMNSVLINISVTSDDAEKAALIANTTGQVFADVVTNQLERPYDGAPPRVQVDVVQPATVPSDPISPNVTGNLTLGVLLGFVAGVGIAILRTMLDTRVNSRWDVTSLTMHPILGQIAFDPDASERPLLVQESPTSPRAEAFRALRTNLQFLKVEGNPRSFVLTSATSSEGKSTTAVNLAIALAQAGSTVALVDGDLRKPRIAELMGVEGGVGVTDVLIGQVQLADALQAWGQPNLVILPAGRRAPNPSELLGSQEMADLLATLDQEFDYLIVDAPPILAVTDAALIAKEVGGALMVAATGKVRKDELSEAIAVVEHIDARVLGIVMTMIPKSGVGFSSYAYAEYSSPEGQYVTTNPRSTSGLQWRDLENSTPCGEGTIIGARHGK